MSKSTPKKNSIIILNVGGKKVQTLKSTLTQLPFFDSYLSRWSKEDEIFIDQDFEVFIHLLNKLRNQSYIVPDCENINVLFDYFGCSLYRKDLVTTNKKTNVPLIKEIYASYPQYGEEHSVEVNKKILIFAIYWQMKKSEIFKKTRIYFRGGNQDIFLDINAESVPLFFKRNLQKISGTGDNRLYLWNFKTKYLNILNNYNNLTIYTSGMNNIKIYVQP